jgi:uncharacterized membrane protein YfcA
MPGDALLLLFAAFMVLVAALMGSLLAIAINSATAFTARVALTSESVDWPPIATFTAVAVAVAVSLLGARLATRLLARTQTAVFAGVLIIVAIYTSASTLA